jgi:4-hydroxy-tetrahydrodipicolinate reductase
MLKVAVNGASGKMGRQVCMAVLDDTELELTSCADLKDGFPDEIFRSQLGGKADSISCFSDVDSMLAGKPEVMVDFTHPDTVLYNVKAAINASVNAVIGTTGLAEADLSEIKAALEGSKTNIIVAPNFAVGAVLMMEMAKMASKYMDGCEVIELHHSGKADAPSGTSLKTAGMVGDKETPRLKDGEKETLECARGGVKNGVHIHSVRLPGLVAHQEVIFGGLAQTLTIRHDSIGRESFMPGVIMAVKAVGTRRGLTYGLENLMDIGR